MTTSMPNRIWAARDGNGNSFWYAPKDGQIVAHIGIEYIRADLQKWWRIPDEPTPEMLERLAKSFHPQMEAESVRYLWRNFKIALNQPNGEAK